MSKHSFSYNLNQRKYSLKYIIYLFILFDIFLYFNISIELFLNVVTWEILVFAGMLIGLRAQARYREFVYEMIALRKDPKYDKKEDLRGHRLIRLIDRIMIDYDLYLENQNKKFIKSTKKRGERRLIYDDIVKKQLGYALIAILALTGFAFGYVLALIPLHWILVFVISGTWEILDTFLFFYIHYVFNIEPEPVTKNKEITEPVII